MLYDETPEKGMKRYALMTRYNILSPYTIVTIKDKHHIRYNNIHVTSWNTLETAQKMAELYSMQAEMGIKEPHAYIAGE